MPFLTPTQLQEIYKAKGVQNNPKAMQDLYQKIKGQGFTVNSESVGQNVQKQLSAIPQANTGNLASDAWQGAKNVTGYALGSVPRLFGGTAKEAIGGVGDVFQAGKNVLRGNFGEATKNLAQGTARVATAPASGLSSAVTGRTLGQIGQKIGSEAMAGGGRALEGTGQMLGGLVRGAGAIGTGQFGKALEQAGDDLNIGRTKLIGGTSQAIFSPFTAATEKTPIGQLGSYVGKNFMEGMNTLGVDTSTEKGAAMAEAIGQVPMLLGGVKGIKMGALDKVPNIPGAVRQAVKTPIQSVVKPIASTIGKTNRASLGLQAKIAGTALSPIAKLTKAVAPEMLSRLSNLNKSSMAFIAKNPKDPLTRDILKGKLTREDAVKTVLKDADDLKTKLSETGSAYEGMRGSTDRVKLPPKTIENFLDKHQIKVDGKGKLFADLDTVPLTKADLSSLQELVNMTRGKTELSAKQFLNLRKQIDNLNVFKEGKSPAIKGVATDLRKTFDSLGKAQIKGLKELDAQYAPLAKEWSGIRKTLFDKDGNLKEGASSKIANLTSKANVERLKKFEKLSPGITKKIQALQVLEDMENASGLKVGGYTRGTMTAGTGFAALSGNLPLAAIGAGVEILTHPKILANIIQKYGAGKLAIEPVTKRINQYLKAGMTDVEAVTKAIGRGSSKAVQEKLRKEKALIKEYVKETKQNIQEKGTTRGSIKNPLYKGGDEALLQEAKKYKSVDEFVEGQGKTIYHGTDKIFDNFDVNKSADGTIWFTDNVDKIKGGEVSASGKGVIMERFINEKNLKLAGWEQTDKYSTGELIRQGYDGVRLPDGDEITYQIFYPEKLKTSAQLQSIWNQAHSKN